MVTRPLVGEVTVVISRARLLLPAPLGPTMPTASPAAMVRSGGVNRRPTATIWSFDAEASAPGAAELLAAGAAGAGARSRYSARSRWGGDYPGDR